MTTFLKIFLSLVLVAGFFATSVAKNPSPQLAYAEETPNIWNFLEKQGELDTKDIFSPPNAQNEYETIPELVGQIIDIALISISTVALFAMVAGGVMMIISSTDENLFGKGKNIVIYSLVGIVIAFLSFLIVRFIDVLFK